MNKDRKTITDFDEYIRQGEPEKREKAYIWQTAIGLQAVDGLTTSDYLNKTAKRHIEGEIDIDEVRELIKTYYRSKSYREPDDEKREADGVSANISKILSNRTLDFSTQGYIALHRRIFAGIFKHAGRVRDYNITKKEWVLENETVNYLNWEDLRRALDYDIEQERNFSYKGITADAMISHITRFVSGLWQIHAFGEGNTRTTAVFTIQYLRSIGFDITNDMFAKHSWYFRNALVRANYKNALKGIDYTPVYLERFFRNLLLGERWDLRNRYLHINPAEEWKVQPNLADRTSAGQVQDKCEATDDTLQDKRHTNNPNIEKLVRTLGEQQMSVKQIMEALGLKGRDNFLNLYLKPSISNRHSCQKYLLTTEGLALYREIIDNP